MHMMSKSDLTLEEQDTSRKSKESCTIISSDGSITATEEAAVYVRDLDRFYSTTPIIGRFGKLCEKCGYSYEWKEKQSPILPKSRKLSKCKSENVVPTVVPGVIDDTKEMQMQHRETERRQLRKTKSEILQTGL